MNDHRTRGAWWAGLACGLIAAIVPGSAVAQTQIKPYIMIVFDTSGSMAWDSAGGYTWGDGTRDPWGARWCCPGSGTVANPSRLYACKSAIYRFVSSTGDVAFGLTKFPQTFVAGGRAMDWYFGNQVAGAYDNMRYAGACNSGTVTDYRVVDIDGTGDNVNNILMWVDQREYSAANTPISGTERELRADGSTPIGWTLGQTETYLGTLVAGDATYRGCRPYKVILLTDGEETCGGDPVGAVTSLRTTVGGGYSKDVRTCVIFYGSGTGLTTADAMASAGRCFDTTTTAFTATNEDQLAAALFQIVDGTVLTEVCDYADNDCDTLIDEGFTKYCDRPGGHLAQDRCNDPGETVCDGLDDNCNGATDEGLLNACGTCGALTELCGDSVDNDCDGATDEGCPVGCVPELCNGLDDDCDTLTDEGIGSRPCGSNVGQCTYGAQSCVGGTWSACTGGQGPVAETCNNRDDNCDGMTDGITRSCGSSTGVCVPGSQICTTGAWLACAGGYNGTTEVCNLLDDDCDGSTDEGNPGGGAACGTDVGECVHGTTTCTGGTLVCAGGTGAVPETCNNRDDDCDGFTDEGNPGGGAACYTGAPATRHVGACADGVQQCTAGVLACTGQTLPAVEACNNRDDDCDGSTDEGIAPRSCGTDVGECVAGSETCSSGAWVCSGSVGPVAEVCDLRDNDCDGATDEGNPGGGVPCGWDPAHPELWDLGACDPGLTTCTAGALVCTGMIGPTPELCNGADDDCDGTIDEGATASITCSPPPAGICVAGTPTCVGGIPVCVGEVPGTTEICNNIDDDCDGLTDEGLTRPCGTDEGACALGLETCVAGVWGSCTGGTGPAAETCNNVDDDCDGVTDGVTRPCGTDTGECTFGTATCWAGAWGVCIGGLGAVAEVCNGLDDDCDGSTDEGDPGGGADCGGSLGECRPGTVRCLGGRLQCDGGTEPTPELCDRLDNDCDGATDEGNPGGGAACYTADPATRGVGVCEDGITQCVAGDFVCSGETGPHAETCNALDDDCDGATDEDLPVGSCGTDEGECSAGIEHCVDGAPTCEGEVGPTPEICDLLDNDCDGETDEANPGGAVPCGWSADPASWDLGLCEPGIANCESGTIVCTGMIGPVPEECNGLDDDCNGLTDDGLSLGEPCGTDEGICTPGNLQCVDGATQCIGGSLPGFEGCNCLDDDCDGSTDEDVVCGGGAVCLDCSCALPCDPFREFSCPDPKVCTCGLVEDDPSACFCVRSGLACGGVECGPCEECVSDTCVPKTCPECQECAATTGECQDMCLNVTCEPGISECICEAGDARCEPINCYLPGHECPDGFICEAAACIEDPCRDVTCDAGTFCREGTCHPVCEAGLSCPDGQICYDGGCVDDACYGVTCVTPGVTCVDGECPGDPGTTCEHVDCAWPLVCRDGICIDEICSVVHCPAGTLCERGTCVETGGDGDADADADADGTGDGADVPLDRTRVLATGAGGCSCRAPGGETPDGGLLGLCTLIGAALLLRRRGRSRPPCGKGGAR